MMNKMFFLFGQKMDKNKDGVVTIDEFIDCCQNVRLVYYFNKFLVHR